MYLCCFVCYQGYVDLVLIYAAEPHCIETSTYNSNRVCFGQNHFKAFLKSKQIKDEDDDEEEDNDENFTDFHLRPDRIMDVLHLLSHSHGELVLENRQDKVKVVNGVEFDYHVIDKFEQVNTDMRPF